MATSGHLEIKINFGGQRLILGSDKVLLVKFGLTAVQMNAMVTFPKYVLLSNGVIPTIPSLPIIMPASNRKILFETNSRDGSAYLCSYGS